MIDSLLELSRLELGQLARRVVDAVQPGLLQLCRSDQVTVLHTTTEPHENAPRQAWQWLWRNVAARIFLGAWLLLR